MLNSCQNSYNMISLPNSVQMSTLKKNTTAKRLAILASKGEKVFHISDLANLWLIKDQNTLRVTLKRYVDAGLLNRIYRGFYSLLPLKEIDPLLLGAKALHLFCYVSTETILFRHGLVSQKPSAYTLISGRSKRFKIKEKAFRSRKLSNKYLYNPAGIVYEDGILIASLERAIADLLYFNPRAHFDKTVNWKKIKELQKNIGYPLTKERYANSQQK